MRIPAAVDSMMFSKLWWSLPLPARFASIEASNAGLAISIEVRKISGYWEPIPCLVWKGKAEHFRATSYFSDGIVAKRSSGKWAARGLLRGCVYPDGEGRFIYVIEHCNYYRKSVFTKGAKVALADESYLNFRDAVMAGFPLAAIVADDSNNLAGGSS